MDKLYQYQNILISTSIFLPLFLKINSFFDKNIQLLKIVDITLKQYTNWNLALVIINYHYNNDYMNIFLSINSTTVFVIYHIFHFNNKCMIKNIPNIPKDMNYTYINSLNLIVHILPFLSYVKYFYILKNSINYNIGFNVILFNMIWALQCFQSFDPHTVYFQIQKNNVYYLWIFLIILNSSLGVVFIQN